MFGKLVIVVVLAVAAYLTPGTRGFSGWILFLGVIIAFVIEGVRIVPQQFAYVVERLGRFHEVLEPGLNLIIPFLDRPPGTRLLVEIRADDILLARQPIAGLSARNQIPGIVERIVSHGPEAEAVVRTAGLAWIVSLVAPAVEQLELKPGTTVQLVVKARSCHMLGEGTVSFGTASCTVEARNPKSSPKIVCSSRTSPRTASPAEVNADSPAALRIGTRICSSVPSRPQQASDMIGPEWWFGTGSRVQST